MTIIALTINRLIRSTSYQLRKINTFNISTLGESRNRASSPTDSINKGSHNIANKCIIKMLVIAVTAKAFSKEKELILSRAHKEYTDGLDPRSNLKPRSSSKEKMLKEQF